MIKVYCYVKWICGARNHSSFNAIPIYPIFPPTKIFFLVDAYCVVPEPRLKLLPIATRPYSAMLDACFVITTLMKRPENSFQLTVGRWKFNLGRELRSVTTQVFSQQLYENKFFSKFFKDKFLKEML